MRAGLLALTLIACGGPAPCMSTFTGNYTAVIDGAAACPTLRQAGEAGWVLSFSPGGLAVSLELGPTPAVGTLGSATTSSAWRAVSTREPGCAYTAGTAAVPRGAFTLELSDVQTAKGVVHGRLELLQYVHALTGADCGPGDVEQVTLEF